MIATTTTSTTCRESRARSGYRGVYRHRSGAWYGRIRFAGSTHYLGCFPSEVEASAAVEARLAELRAGQSVEPPQRIAEDEPEVVPVAGPRPTAAQPGSPEKVAVLAERAAQHVQLWHPDDAVHPHRWNELVTYIRRLAPEALPCSPRTS